MLRLNIKMRMVPTLDGSQAGEHGRTGRGAGTAAEGALLPIVGGRGLHGDFMLKIYKQTNKQTNNIIERSFLQIYFHFREVTASHFR